MNNVDLQKKKIQIAILMIAKDIEAICDKYNIPYFISSGTMLGAIRHKGFIPWDDDFDIGMKRREYDRFIEICKREMDQNKYFIQDEYTEENYAFSFCKIQLNNTYFMESFSENVPIKHGIFVDVFPYDNIPNNEIKRRVFLIKNHLLKNILWVKCGYGDDEHKKKLSYKIMKTISFLYSIKRLKKQRRKLLYKYNNTSTAKSFSSDYPREQLNNSWFNDLKKYEFENTYFLGFKEYDTYLTFMYGNYMQLPPESERISHTQTVVDFGPYDKVLEEI